MLSRKVVFVALAVTVALGAAYSVKNFASKRSDAAISAEPVVVVREATLVEVLVAARDLPGGTILADDDLVWQSWPETAVAPSFVLNGGEADEPFPGAVVRRRIGAGEPVTRDRVVQKGERGFLAAILTPGMRGVSVPVNATSGVGGLLFPGDRVDVILSHEIGGGAAAGDRRRRASETVLQNVRLLAVDQSTENVNNLPAVAKTATLEVTPNQAEVLAVVVDMGRLSLSLRSLGLAGQDVSAVAPVPARARSYTLDSNVSSLLVSPRAPTKAEVVRVQVVRGRTTEALSFSAGNPRSAIQTELASATDNGVEPR